MKNLKSNPGYFRNLLLIIVLVIFPLSCDVNPDQPGSSERAFNGIYENEYLNRVAFPMGGIGAGMICLEGTGGISHVSVRNKPDIFNEPVLFSALSIKGLENGAKVLEGPVANWKVFGSARAGNGNGKGADGYPHFEKATFSARFPFATVDLEDDDIPLDVSITGWSPFIPGDADNSSLPVASLEYRFKNISNKAVEALFSCHAENFMQIEAPSVWGGAYDKGGSIAGIRNGFLLRQSCTPEKAHYKGGFYSPEALEILKKEGPKYQYGNGCLSDGILGNWIGEMCYLDNFLDAEKVKSHLVSIPGFKGIELHP